MIPQEVVLYMSPDVLDQGGTNPRGAVCGKCMMFLNDIEACVILRPPAVSGANGVCGLFIGGETTSSDRNPPQQLVPAEMAGYTDDAPTRCGNCRNFLPRTRCRSVEGTVHEDGCCNGWERKGS